MKRVGIVGLGIMGGAIAHNLSQSAATVWAYDINPIRRKERAREGLQVVDSLAELLSGSDVILTSLPSASAVDSVVGSIAAAQGSRKIVVEASTLALENKFAAKKLLDSAGHVLLDCPISGTGAQAKSKDLVIYASGDAQTIESLNPFFSGFSRQAWNVGEFGNGSRVKFIANLLVAIHNVATAEAMLLAKRAGLDLEMLVKLITAGAGNSRIFELRAPLMSKGDYGHATMKMNVWQKDMAIIGKFAKGIGAPTPLFSATERLYADAIASGHGEDDTASVFTALESMAQNSDRQF